MPPPPPPFPHSNPASAPTNKTKWWLIGCGGCLSLMILGLIAVGAIVFGVFKMIENSDAYKVALSTATSSPEVQEALGTPIKPGWLLTGNVNSNITNGVTTETADLTIPLSGPKASASLHFAGKKTEGQWNVDDATVTVEGTGQKIHLEALEVEKADPK